MTCSRRGTSPARKRESYRNVERHSTPPDKTIYITTYKPFLDDEEDPREGTEEVIETKSYHSLYHMDGCLNSSPSVLSEVAQSWRP
ncbi:hypothetical protein PAXRUDRAFT_433676 [Paxillus rubicundulus Ve08.2h10]|uniref:Unplaced genomic scaffold scaffold_27, whole genome shotgun sequence n=1 Tax=Paxillus rubicundulus Ve08.2h10 TaxID=930991 RepID=A0A0D0E5C4_9AGAM|nr:hypothetical protein PAXRUDRAFT_433676 [Paxillus rubicundulus Ve08.2h10]